MSIPLSKSELLALPTLYTINDLNSIVYKFLGDYLGHLNLKQSSLVIPSIQLDIVRNVKSLQVSLPYSSSYDYYNVWQLGILKYNTVPNLLLVNSKPNVGPLIYLLGDVNITKTILYVISQQMEIVQDSFANSNNDVVLNYRGDITNLVEVV
jgi:hypothetical protein